MKNAPVEEMRISKIEEIDGDEEKPKALYKSCWQASESCFYFCPTQAVSLRMIF
jgi:hypothetical protein